MVSSGRISIATMRMSRKANCQRPVASVAPPKRMKKTRSL
jgi:hypothetical protein